LLNNSRYVEASAKTGKNVEDSFFATSSKIFEKIKNGDIDPNCEI
jgi:GTPase SAR1 family protein